MKKILLALLILFLIRGSQASAQNLTLDSCYILAVNNYPLIKQYDLIEKSKEYTLSNANKAYLPQVSITAIGGYIIGGLPIGGTGNNSNFKLIGLAEISQTIWDGGATKAQKEIIEASAETEKANVMVALYDLRSRVNQLYFGILIVDEQMKQLDQREIVLKNNEDKIRQMNENGLAYTTDLAEIQVEQLKLNQQKVEFNYVRQGYIQMLSFITGIELGGQITFEKPHEELTSLELQNVRPELSLYESQRKQIEANNRLLRVGLMPKVGILGGGVMFYPKMYLGPTSLSSLGVVGISSSWSISGLYQHSNNKSLSQISLQKIDVHQSTFLFNTNLQATQAKADIMKQKSIIEKDEEIVKLRTSIREGYQLKYNNGMCSLLDLLDATQKESDANCLKVLHNMELLKTIYEYKTMTGN